MTDQKSTSGKRRPTKKTATPRAAAKAAAKETAVSASDATSIEAAARGRKTRTPRVETATKAVAKPLKAPAPLFDAPLPTSVTSALRPVEAIAPFSTAVAAARSPDGMIAPAARLMEAGVQQARQTYAQAQSAGETFRQAMSETAQASARGALEVNGKLMEALRAQSDAALDAWRSALTAGSLSEAISLQAAGVRQVCETAATCWKDVAETTQHWVGATVKPLQSLTNQSR